jgi:hypothetical protein
MPMPGWEAIASPTTCPVPFTTLNTPGGRPASEVTSAKIRTDSGASSDGLRTTVLPASIAGATLVTSCCSGKFHGVIAPTTPIDSRTINEVAISSVHGKLSASSAVVAVTMIGSPTWAVREKAIGTPSSAVIVAAISSVRA